VQRESQKRKILIVGRDRRTTFQEPTEVVAEESDEAADEWGNGAATSVFIGGRHPRLTTGEAAELRARVGEWIATRPCGVDDAARIGREVAPSRSAARSRALEEGEPGDTAERLRSVHRRHGVERREPFDAHRLLDAGLGGRG
jgi:hypothetical protein